MILRVFSNPNDSMILWSVIEDVLQKDCPMYGAFVFGWRILEAICSSELFLLFFSQQPERISQLAQRASYKIQKVLLSLTDGHVHDTGEAECWLNIELCEGRLRYILKENIIARKYWLYIEIQMRLFDSEELNAFWLFNKWILHKGAKRFELDQWCFWHPYWSFRGIYVHVFFPEKQMQRPVDMNSVIYASSPRSWLVD